jgi:hypothetical protein
MSDSLRDRIAAAVDNFYIYDPCWHPDDWKVAVANAVIAVIQQENDDIRPALKDALASWEDDD